MDTPATDGINPINPHQNAAAEESITQTWRQWASANAVVLIVVAIAIGYIIWKQLDVWDIFKVVIGLGLVIFIHELGHFLAAKWCDVHVETFSIGFGKPLPGCYFRYGETTYKIGWIPLGGFVKMVGEGDNADSEDAEEDPRSFKNKPVGQRMLIISAGVIMNIFLACVCFIIAYMHGVDENPAIIAGVEAGSPAWQEGVHSSMTILDIDGTKNPVFNDVKPTIMSTSKGETVSFVMRDDTTGEIKTYVVEPVRDSDALFPTVGIGPSFQLVLQASKRKDITPLRPGSVADQAKFFQANDKIVASSYDPKDYKLVKPIPPDARPDANGKLDYFEFHRRQQDMRGKKMIVEVERGDGKHQVTIEPEFYYKTGMRMEMGRVAARRKDSPAAKAKVIEPAGESDGVQTGKFDQEQPAGDKIILVEVEDESGRKIRWQADPATDAKDVIIKPLDPLRLPFELEQWAERKGKDRKVLMTVLRPTGRKEEKNENKRVTMEMEWDDSAKYYREVVSGGNTPISIPCLGLAYHITAVVDAVEPNSPASKAGIQKGDEIKEVQWKTKNSSGEVEGGDWNKIKSHQWASVAMILQLVDIKDMGLKIVRNGNEQELSLTAEADETWPVTDRGFHFKYDSRLHQAKDLLDALGIGLHNTVRLVRVIYLNLYSMVFGRVSAKTMSGPLSIADVSYKIAGENIWQFILFIGMINVNLAVINFLPIPVLDGGHMVFLIYEKIRGKPAPQRILEFALYTGFALIMTLMCFVLFLDVKRLFF